MVEQTLPQKLMQRVWFHGRCTARQRVVSAGLHNAVAANQYVVSPGQAPDSPVRCGFSVVVSANQSRHIGGIDVRDGCRSMQSMGFAPAAHHLAVQLKQGLTMKGIGLVNPC